MQISVYKNNVLCTFDSDLYEYSDIALSSVFTPAAKSSGHIIAYPNPAHTFTNMNVTTTYQGIASIHIVDITGQVVYYNTVTLQKGSNLGIVVPTAQLRSGIYFLEVTNGHEQFTSKLIVAPGH